MDITASDAAAPVRPGQRAATASAVEPCKSNRLGSNLSCFCIQSSVRNSTCVQRDMKNKGNRGVNPVFHPGEDEMGRAWQFFLTIAITVTALAYLYYTSDYYTKGPESASSPAAAAAAVPGQNPADK